MKAAAKKLARAFGSDLGLAGLAALLIFAGVAYRVSTASIASERGSRQVVFDVREQPAPEPAPEAPRPPEPKPRPAMPVKPGEAAAEPPPLASSAPPPEAPAETTREPVFGASANSVAAAGDSAFAMRVGHTLDKDREERFTDPRGLGPYVPEPIYLITAMPRPREVVRPVYPPQARSEGREASLLLQVDIDAEGWVRKVKIIKSAGFGFDEAAIDALYSSRYHPAMMGDAAVAVSIKVPIRFVLTD